MEKINATARKAAIGAIICIGAFFGSFGFASALSTFIVPQGGTGVNTFSSSQLIYGNGTTALSSVATTSVTCSGSTTCTSFTAIGGSPITISSTAGSGSGTVSTSSSETANYIPKWTSTNGTPALLAGTSLIYDSGTAIGISSTTPGSVLSVGTSPNQVANFATATSTIYSNLSIGSGASNTYLAVGTTTPVAGYLRNYLADFTGTFNDFTSINVNNNTNGICSSADLTATNDAGTVSANFVDLGHTSSAFTGAGCTNNPFSGFGSNSSYLFDPNGNMNFAIASTSDASFRWFAGGYALANRKMTLTNAGFLGVGTTTPTKELSVTGSLYVGSTKASVIGEADPLSAFFALATTDNLWVASSTSGSNGLRGMAITASSAISGNGAVQAFNAVGIINSSATANNTNAVGATGGGLRGGRIISSNMVSGFNVAGQTAIELATNVGGILASTTAAHAVYIEAPTVSSGDLLTNFYGIRIHAAAVTGTLTSQAGLDIGALTAGTNNTEVLLGTETIPSGNYGIYQSDTNNNYLAGNTGIGTTTPFAQLSIAAIGGSANISLFAIGSSTAAFATSTLFAIDNVGHIITGSSKGSLSSCGSTNSLNGNDVSGTIMFTGTLVTACTLTFANPTPANQNLSCVVSDNSLTGFPAITSTSSTAVTFGISTGLASGSLFYHCDRNVNN